MARVLVIDDDSQVLGMLEKALQRAGYDVMATTRAQEAMTLFRKEPADLIITDIFMPEKEGLETILEFKREAPDVKIIAISGGSQHITSFNCLQAAKNLGADSSLAKPFSRKKLLDVVSELLG